MKHGVLFLVVVSVAVAASREPGVPVRQAQPDTSHLSLLTPPGGENQKLYGSRRAVLVNDEAARAVTERFRAAYAKDGAPRVAVFVNRAVAEEEQNSGEAIADRQTEREIERLFGRVFRHGGAILADARAATALVGDEAEENRIAEPRARERTALKQVADFVIEVLVSSRPMTVATLSGDATLEVPDLQVFFFARRGRACGGRGASVQRRGYHGSDGVRVDGGYADGRVGVAMAQGLLGRRRRDFDFGRRQRLERDVPGGLVDLVQGGVDDGFFCGVVVHDGLAAGEVDGGAVADFDDRS